MQDARQTSSGFFIHTADKADNLWAEWIAWQLEEARYSVVLPEWQFRPGQNRVLATHNALIETEHVILILSPAAVKALAHDPIWAAAFAQDPDGLQRKLLPVRVQPCDPGGLLGPVIPIDLFAIDEATARASLLSGVDSGRARPTTPPIFPGSVASVSAQRPRFPARLPAIWNIPHYNQYFTDRTETLAELSSALDEGTPDFVHTYVINGLSGVGKTQVALAYAHLYSYRYEACLWIDASQHTTLLAGIASIADALKLELSEAEKQQEQHVVAAVKQWLQEHHNWLLIVDNIEDPGTLRGYIPSIGNGHVLFTARTQTIGTIAQALPLRELQPEDGVLFLLRRAKVIASGGTLDKAPISERDNAYKLTLAMGNLPLALDQAGAYIEETGNNVSGYLNYYRRYDIALLEKRGDAALNHQEEHPEPVTTTWLPDFEAVQQSDPAAYELLQFCAFLHHDSIPEELLIDGATELSPALQRYAHNPLQVENLIMTLRKYSLLYRDPIARTLSIQPLVQAVIRRNMQKQQEQQWSEWTVRAVHRVFLDAETLSIYTTLWQCCQRYFPHVQACAALIELWNIRYAEAAQLLYTMGCYLQKHRQSVQSPSSVVSVSTWKEIKSLDHPSIPHVLHCYIALLRSIHYHDQANALTTLL